MDENEIKIENLYSNEQAFQDVIDMNRVSRLERERKAKEFENNVAEASHRLNTGYEAKKLTRGVAGLLVGAAGATAAVGLLIPKALDAIDQDTKNIQDVGQKGQDQAEKSRLDAIDGQPAGSFEMNNPDSISSNDSSIDLPESTPSPSDIPNLPTPVQKQYPPATPSLPTPVIEGQHTLPTPIIKDQPSK